MNMESKVEGCLGDYPNSGSSLVLMNQHYGYNHVERFRFRNMFMKILEELRMRRASDRENDKRIHELVQDKYMLEKKADQESQRCLVLEERHASETRDACMKLEDRMRDLKTEATQQHIHRTVVEKENETYKNQLQALQRTNYSLERKVRELEVKLQLQIRSSEKHLGQLTEFENKYSTVVQQEKQLAESQGTLEKQDADKNVSSLERSLNNPTAGSSVSPDDAAADVCYTDDDTCSSVSTCNSNESEVSSVQSDSNDSVTSSNVESSDNFFDVETSSKEDENYSSGRDSNDEMPKILQSLSENEQQALKILSVFQRHNLTTSTCKDILQTMKSMFPNSKCVDVLDLESIYSFVDIHPIQEVHYCGTCDKVFPNNLDEFRCSLENCGGFRYKGRLLDQQKKDRQPRKSFILADTKKQLKHLLETPVKKALELNRNLMYVNEHQKCILAMKNADLSRLQSEVLDLKVAQSTQSDQQGMKLQLEIDNTCLKQKLENSIKEKECLFKDCENWKEKYQGSVASLQEAHSLIAVNLQNLERYRSEVRCNEERIEELEAEIDDATLSLTSVNIMMEEERKTFSTTEQKWHAQEERYLCDIEQLKTELSVLKTQLEKKDSAQQEVVNQVTSLNKELDMLKTIANVEKDSLSCQTDLCMQKVEDHDCQTVIEVQCQQVQTERHQTNTSTTQTINAALRNCACQTENNSYNSFSDSPSIPSTQGLGLNEQISAQGSLQVPEDHMNKNFTHKSEKENAGIQCIRKEESDIGCSNRDSSAIQTPLESKFVDVARVISDTKLDNQYADEEFEATLTKSEVSGNISEFYSVNYHKSVVKNNNLEAEMEQYPSHVVSLATNITLSSSSGNTNDNLNFVVEDETPEESANIHNSPDQSLDSNLNGSSCQNDDMAATYLATHGCAEDSHLRFEEGVHEEEHLKNETFTQHTEIPQEKEDKKEEEDEIIAPSQPSIFSDGSWVLPTGKKRGLMEGDKCISADESQVSKPKHFKSDIVNEIMGENFVESSSENKTLHLVRRVTYPLFYKSSPHTANTVGTKNVTQHVSSHDSDRIRLSGHNEKQNPCGKDSKSTNIEQSTSCNKICGGTPSAVDEKLSSFMTPTIYMQSCKEARPSLSRKMLSELQSSEKGYSFSPVVGFSPLHRIPQYRLSTKRSLVAQVSSSKQSSISSPRISAVTKSCTPNPSVYSTQDIPSVDVKTEKPKTSLPRFGFLDRKRSIFDEDFNLSSNRVESAVHTEAPHVLYSRFLSSVKPLKSSGETKEAVRCFSVLVNEPDNFSETNFTNECSSPYSNLMPTKGILKDPLTSGTSSPKKVHFSSPLESTVQHQTLEQTKDSLEKIGHSAEDPNFPSAEQ